MNQKIAPPGFFPALHQLMLPSRSQAIAGCVREILPTSASERLCLTGEATGFQALQRKLTSAPAMDTARVESLRAELARGEYQIKPDLIAARMLEMGKQLGQ